MTRAVSSTCRALAARVTLALGLIGMVGSAAHAAKQKVAVLTLEVVGNIDPDNLKLAKMLSNDLRDKVKASADFVLVGGERDVVDEKLMNGCQNEQLTCMAPIGARLDAELLMFGKMERSPKGFQITIKLIRVATHQQVGTWSDDLALKRVVDESKAIAKIAFGKLMPNQSGTLIVKVVNADRATVYIDNEAKGTVSSGLYTTTLPENRYKLVIEPAEKGWNRYEDVITIRAGEPKNVAVELTRIKATPLADPARPSDELKHEIGGTVSQRSSNTGWKVLAAGGLITSAAAGGLWLYSYAKPIGDYKDLLAKRAGAVAADNANYELDSRDCDRQAAEGPAKQAFKDACRARTITKFAIPITIGAGLIGAGALVYVLLKNDTGVEQRPTAVGRRTKPRSLAVTPVVSPDGAGAAVRFDW